jgi:hypothetical protein
MSRPLKVQIVERARALIADENQWCRCDLARDVKGGDSRRLGALPALGRRGGLMAHT